MKTACIYHMFDFSQKHLFIIVCMIFSWQGPDHLTATWKVDDGVYQHIDVKEQGKDKVFNLGKSLHINDEVSSIL